MGVMSRRVVPACGNLCFFCPSFRARSRQPVKRYKKLIAEILPRNQEAEINDRKIGKLCEYASKNPLRIPKITDILEQRFYKELRHENFGSVRAVVCIYRKLLLSCKEQMPLFASSFLGIVETLLEQSQRDDLQVLACNALADFVSNQMDGMYMFKLEDFIPKLCQLAEEAGEGERSLLLRSAALQTLASMIFFMGEQSHMPKDFDNIVSVVLENYVDSQMNVENLKDDCKRDGKESTFPDDREKISLTSCSVKSEMEPPVDISNSPSYWSRVCLQNMAKLAKEATTIRRVLEPLFHNFDVNNNWFLEKGNAYRVLLYLQCLLGEAGENSHVLLSMLIKHLDHKNVSKRPLMHIEIVKVATQLGENAKQQVSVAIIGAISDLMKHLRKCLHNLADSSSAQDGSQKLNADLQFSIEKCISQLSHKVGDVGPILDTMSVFLENISSSTAIARTTISAVHRTAQITSSIPNLSYHKKAFPDALFHQLLIVMVHPDHETRVGAHSVFSIVLMLMPSLLSPCSDQKTIELVGSVLKMSDRFGSSGEGKEKKGSMDEQLRDEGSQSLDPVAKQYTKRNSHGHSNSFKNSIFGSKSLPILRLSSHQIGLLLSSIWIQATFAENLPANFEAMAHAYNIALLFTRSKTSSHMTLVRCFQLAFSLRRIALDQESGFQPSRQRSLFNLASCMLIFSARAGNLPELIPRVKASLTEKIADPYLQLIDDIRLQAISVESENGKASYGSEEDNIAASKSLSGVELDDQHLKETLSSELMTKFVKLSEDELSSMKQQLLQKFSPDDSYPLGGSLFTETSRPPSPLSHPELFNEIMSEIALTDDEAFSEPNGSQSDHKTSLMGNSHGILSANELLQSVLETAQQVANSQMLSNPVPYDQMKHQCEALVNGKQQKMSILQSFKHQPDSRIFPSEDEKKDISVFDSKVNGDDLTRNGEGQITVHNQLAVYADYGQSLLRLPPSNPYDEFLKAADY